MTVVLQRIAVLKEAMVSADERYLKEFRHEMDTAAPAYL